MNHDRPSVACVGSAAFVSLWKVSGPATLPFEGSGMWGGSVQGNDALIVATELTKSGFYCRCYLLDPTYADVQQATLCLGNAAAVVPIGRSKGPQTRSLCIEDFLGNRHWLFSRIPSPKKSLGNIESDILYVDHYAEFEEYFASELIKQRRPEPHLFVNLSSIQNLTAIPSLRVAPYVVQVSVPMNISITKATTWAREIARLTNAKKTFVTMGDRGALLALGTKTWHAPVENSNPAPSLGAGAIFSSKIIKGLAKKLDEDSLLKWAVRETSRHLNSSRK